VKAYNQEVIMSGCKKFKIIAGVIPVFLAAYTSAYAVTNIHIGTLEINPFAAVEQKYDDNIFLEADNQEDDDWITTAAAGLDLKMPIIPGREEDFIFETRYYANFIEFLDNTNQNRVDHNIVSKADFKFASGVTLKIEDNFQKTADPPNSELTDLDKRFRNNINSVVGYMKEKLGIDFGYNNIRDEYNSLNDLDKYEHIFTTTGYYQIFSKASVFGEYNFGEIIYDNSSTNSDSEYNQFRLGIKGEIAPKLTGLVKAGYKETNYKTSGKNDFAGLTTFANVNCAFSERTKLNIFAERSSEESTYSSNSYFEYNQIGLKIDHGLLEKLFLVSSGYYQFNKYPDETTESSATAKRNDQILDGSIGLRYEIKEWVSLGTNYEYKQRESKFDSFDYKDNKITVKVNLIF
jgi:hypothetical protein